MHSVHEFHCLLLFTHYVIIVMISVLYEHFDHFTFDKCILCIFVFDGNKIYEMNEK